mgnify:FL=1
MDNSMQGNSTQEQTSLPFMSAGIASVLNFWQTLFENMVQLSPESDASEGRTSQMDVHRLSGSLQAWNDMAQAAQKAMLQSGGLENLPASMHQVPLVSMSFAHMGMQELTRLAQDWMQGVEQATEHARTNAQNPYQAFMQAYSQSWQKVLNLPQLGPERFRQQRIHSFLDSWTTYSSQLAEFMNQMAVPFEKATSDLHKKLEKMAEEEDGYPQTFQEYYNLWMKILEGHFMVLLQSKEFIGLLHNVVNHYIDFQSTQDQVLQDLLKSFPVPTNDDFDALAKENYELKKRVTQLARKVEALEEKL